MFYAYWCIFSVRERLSLILRLLNSGQFRLFLERYSFKADSQEEHTLNVAKLKEQYINNTHQFVDTVPIELCS